MTLHRSGIQIGELDISLRSMRRRKLSLKYRVRKNGLTASMRRFLKRLLGDITFLRGVWRVIRLTSPIARNPTRIFPLLVDDLAVRHGDKLALASNRERLTYRMLAARSCRYARWAMAQGIRKGDVVGLFMTNRPEYVAIWLGIIRAGGTVALLNTNLTGPALAFCIDSVAPKHVIVAGDLADALSSSEPYRKTAPRIWLHGEVPAGHPRLDEAVLRGHARGAAGVRRRPGAATGISRGGAGAFPSGAGVSAAGAASAGSSAIESTSSMLST